MGIGTESSQQFLTAKAKKCRCDSSVTYLGAVGFPISEFLSTVFDPTSRILLPRRPGVKFEVCRS